MKNLGAYFCKDDINILFAIRFQQSFVMSDLL